MNLIKRIFGKNKLKKVKITQDLEQVLESGGLSLEEILRFRIVRLEMLLLKAKNKLKIFLKSPEIREKK